MAMEILTKDDLEAFKRDFFEEFHAILQKKDEEKTTTPEMIIKANEPQRKWLKSVDVLKMFKIAPSTLLLKRASGEIPYTRIGNTLFYDYDEIMAILQKNKSVKNNV